MVKEKPNSTRIYDEDGFRRRAAAICVKDDLENEVSLFYSKLLFINTNVFFLHVSSTICYHFYSF